MMKKSYDFLYLSLLAAFEKDKKLKWKKGEGKQTLRARIAFYHPGHLCSPREIASKQYLISNSVNIRQEKSCLCLVAGQWSLRKRRHCSHIESSQIWRLSLESIQGKNIGQLLMLCLYFCICVPRTRGVELNVFPNLNIFLCLFKEIKIHRCNLWRSINHISPFQRNH